MSAVLRESVCESVGVCMWGVLIFGFVCGRCVYFCVRFGDCVDE